MYILIGKKLPKLDEKRGKKSKNLFDKKLQKLDKKIRKKIDYLLLYKK